MSENREGFESLKTCIFFNIKKKTTQLLKQCTIKEYLSKGKKPDFLAVVGLLQSSRSSPDRSSSVWQWLRRDPLEAASLAGTEEVRASAPEKQHQVSSQALLFLTFPREAKETKTERKKKSSPESHTLVPRKAPQDFIYYLGGSIWRYFGQGLRMMTFFPMFWINMLSPYLACQLLDWLHHEESLGIPW